MHQNAPPQQPPQFTLLCILTTITITLIFLLSLSSTTTTTTSPSSHNPHLFPPSPYILNTTTPSPPSIAYFLTGSSGDQSSLFRLLLSIYHRNNIYLLHLDRGAPQSDRVKLAVRVDSVDVFRGARNVHVVGNADFVYGKGSTPVSGLLRGGAILIKLSRSWDWFVNLNAGDYPIVTQDDLLHILSYLPKDLNFVNHTSYIGWKESRRMKRIIVDPGLYLLEKAGMFYTTQKRDLPNGYQMFSGAPTSILTRKFIEHIILGSDNFPRTLLMYLSNTQSSLLNYLPTILCNSPDFKQTTINHNLQYASYPTFSKDDPRHLNMSDFTDILGSGSAFATKFHKNDPILDRIDREILGREPDKVVPGGWCLGELNNVCDVCGDTNILRPGYGAKRLEKRVVELLLNGVYRNQQCTV